MYLRRSSIVRYFLRIRTLSGVTSTNSSSAIHSIAVSSVWVTGVASLMPSSWLCVRMLFFSFARTAFTTISSSRAFSPTTIPSYNSSPGEIHSVPRCSRLSSAYAVAGPMRSETIAPPRRCGNSPAHGIHPARLWCNKAVPRVTVNNSDRKPISPREGASK